MGEKKFKIEFEGRDEISIVTKADGKKHFQVVGCHTMLHQLAGFRAKFGPNPEKWPLPSGADHSSLMIRELILRLTNKWEHPYPHEEVCHCRLVTLKTVEQAILSGAHTSEQVTRLTSASSACGTCRPDVEKIIDFRLKAT